jgi:hypothetical protein
VQTGHEHPITGTPYDVPVPSSVTRIWGLGVGSRALGEWARSRQ